MGCSNVDNQWPVDPCRSQGLCQATYNLQGDRCLGQVCQSLKDSATETHQHQKTVLRDSQNDKPMAEFLATFTRCFPYAPWYMETDMTRYDSWVLDLFDFCSVYSWFFTHGLGMDMVWDDPLRNLTSEWLQFSQLAISTTPRPRKNVTSLCDPPSRVFSHVLNLQAALQELANWIDNPQMCWNIIRSSCIIFHHFHLHLHQRQAAWHHNGPLKQRVDPLLPSIQCNGLLVAWNSPINMGPQQLNLSLEIGGGTTVDLLLHWLWLIFLWILGSGLRYISHPCNQGPKLGLPVETQE